MFVSFEPNRIHSERSLCLCLVVTSQSQFTHNSTNELTVSTSVLIQIVKINNREFVHTKMEEEEETKIEIELGVDNVKRFEKRAAINVVSGERFLTTNTQYLFIFSIYFYIDAFVCNSNSFVDLTNHLWNKTIESDELRCYALCAPNC